jgi:mannose-1-phosphate guanylyltransferase/phosphomannomutase
MAGTYQDLIEAHLRVLHGQHPGLLLTGREIAPGVRVSRNATIHRTAKLVGPAFIGENCRIGEYCHLGQGASIGRDCVIENRTVVESSVLCPGSYVGEGLELRQVYVDRGWLVNTRLGAEIDNVDECLLGSVYASSGRLAKKAVSWIR